jgi:hypothetical protein
VADVEPSPLFAHRLLEAALQRVAVGRLGREEREHGVVQRHVTVLLHGRNDVISAYIVTR